MTSDRRCSRIGAMCASKILWGRLQEVHVGVVAVLEHVHLDLNVVGRFSLASQIDDHLCLSDDLHHAVLPTPRLVNSPREPRESSHR